MYVRMCVCLRVCLSDEEACMSLIDQSAVRYHRPVLIGYDKLKLH